MLCTYTCKYGRIKKSVKINIMTINKKKKDDDDDENAIKKNFHYMYNITFEIVSLVISHPNNYSKGLQSP